MYIKLFEDNPNTRDILKVVEVLKAGGIIIYPTDTIYAIGCDINNVKAVQRVCQLKNIKPEKANFSMICRDLSNIAAYAKVNNEVFKVMKRNLPGPFTFVLPATNKLPNVMINRRKTIGIRIPDNYIVMSRKRNGTLHIRIGSTLVLMVTVVITMGSGMKDGKDILNWSN